MPSNFVDIAASIHSSQDKWAQPLVEKESFMRLSLLVSDLI